MKIGILFSNIEYNQLIHYVSEFVNRNHDIDLIGFFDNNYVLSNRLNFATMQSNELYSYDGIGIATDISTAEKLLHSPSLKKRYLYLWDLEWLRHPQKVYHDFAKIYRNKEIKIIARTKDHADLIENCFNVKVKYIADNFKIEKILCQKRVNSIQNLENNG